MNLPNKLTTLRVIMIPFFVVFMLADMGRTGDYIALALFCLASLTDFFDGYLARKNHLVTNFGKFMDPLADKLLVGSAAICLIEMGRIPAWVVVILISREFIISGFRLIAADNGVVIAASMWGKFKTVCQMFMTIALILHLDTPVWAVVEQVLIWGSVALTIVSLVDYIYKNRHVLKDGHYEV
ncbi:CDP-diacylglycerol--glycerol-3-phosphate 3-phosphatidyltransferase [Hominifimenecus microfluidus]|uniref:CDP-diacylglycerol--glycerol-3-phosphate 3-phosphatidyltransferase n=1 Tax=Hominifimenecus microfluidus TaxID=2885348 RepID=A0AAE3JFI0_9FIRM|nr:CDP-diacylglycerol--glycerol-3-phosphate 3-phosphatidyltransferase [Hominifimenecus microfluidus]MCC2231383.1 CDP-diacylglycerol--glycerol-3-phosphate 3-phosphatidyltransferase [Hominifimenecus microfluidus]